MSVRSSRDTVKRAVISVPGRIKKRLFSSLLAMDSTPRSFQDPGTTLALVIILQYGVFFTHQRVKIFQRRFAKECHLEALVLGLEDQLTEELARRVRRSENVVLIVDPSLDRNEVERKVQSTSCHSLTKRLANNTALVVRFHQGIFKTLLPPIQQTEAKARLAEYVLSRQSQITLKRRPAAPAAGNSGATKKARRIIDGASALPTNVGDNVPEGGNSSSLEGNMSLPSGMATGLLRTTSLATAKKNAGLISKIQEWYKYSKANKSLQQRHEEELAIPRLLGALRGLDFKISLENLDRLEGIPYVGKSYVRIIAEILQTGSFTRLKMLQSNEKSNCCLEFVKIFGIGPSLAAALYELGIAILATLRTMCLGQKGPIASQAKGPSVCTIC